MFSLVFFLIPLLTSCTGKIEIDELALVMAVGLDKGEKEGSIRVTTQVARPADARGQTGAPSGQTGDPIWSASAEGETIFEAIRNLASFSSRRVFWAHNYAIVINEDLAREIGIGDIIDFFTRNPQLRMRTWVVVTPDKASEVISTITGLEVVPGEAIDKLFRYTTISTHAPQTQMMDLQAAYLSEETQPVLARVKLQKRGVSNKKEGQSGSYKQVDLAGAGIFKDDKLVGIVQPDEVKGLLPFIETVESGVIGINCPSDPTKKLSVEVLDQSFDLKPMVKNNLPAFEATIDIYGAVVEAGCPFTLKDRDQVEKIEKLVAEEIKSQIETVFNKAQVEKSDFLQLGKVFNNRYPLEWKGFKDEWGDLLPSITLKVHSTAHVNESALLYNPTESGK
ncbi:Ger(x)C family spore germination protein [Litchfieldia salsa]|uniref:Germination protein, Ger(X)C family n=1 Tax=Litchfieldia salsa TaxID=930152 RepID=A0A1H0WH82_9BACI|nr:Ger(x)C family spore germination protein [Litchfieldia salsa]SDP90139.1 germination protein, Ger(x)C family [Litchfieldia salsa]